MARILPFFICLILMACSPAPEALSPTVGPTATRVPPSATASQTGPPPTATGTFVPTATPAPVAAATSTPLPAVLCSPLGGYALEELSAIVSQPFIAPRPAMDDGHHGTDFAHYAYGERTTIAGAPVQAVFSGVIAASTADSWPYGNFVIVESRPDQVPPEIADRLGLEGLSLYHLYAHLEQTPEIEIGSFVEACALLGTVGNTGWSGNYHLHLETRIGPPGVTFPEMAYYQTTTTESERENYERWRFGGEFVPLDPMGVFER